jgi:uncharacterized protein
MVEEVRSGYAFEGPALELGALVVDADRQSDVRVRIPLGTLNRHGLIAGATGTGRTRTVQLLAEQMSAHGVPVFAPDIKGDLSGLSAPGEVDDEITARARAVGQQWTPAGFPVEYYELGGQGTGVPLRVTMSSFGPTLLAKVLGLNATQASSLGLVFHYADKAGLPLLDLADLRAVVQFLVSDEGKDELEQLGGLAIATAGEILRELIAFGDQGADAYFGEPEFETTDLLRVTPDGRGVISLLNLPDLQDRPAVSSTFLVWLLADLFHELPEAEDPERPSLVFFLDEAHLLVEDATKDFLDALTRTLRLVRSKGVGVFFVTRSPTDVPAEVLAQLGSRVQHQLRAHTPDDPTAQRATVGTGTTDPTSGHDDLGEVLGTGEAVVTVMNERGTRTPTARTRLRAPESLMSPVDDEAMTATFVGSPMKGKYATPVDRESAREILAERLERGADKARAEQREDDRAGRPADPAAYPEQTGPGGPQGPEDPDSVLQSSVARQLMRTTAREVVRGLFRVGRR